MSHWTSNDDKSFLSRITFDFVAQLEQKLETTGTTQADLATEMGVSEGAVSQVMGLSRTNLNLKTMARYARALGMKLAVVAYDDGDRENLRGPVGSEIFAICWERLGMPRDRWSIDVGVQAVASNYASALDRIPREITTWRSGWANSTLSCLPSTTYEPPTHILKNEPTEEASTAHARS